MTEPRGSGPKYLLVGAAIAVIVALLAAFGILGQIFD
jgi:hypothetical protein